MSNTLQFTCTVTNGDSDHPLQFLGPLPHIMIRTLRLYISGVPVEVVEDANRLHQMFTLCLSKDHQVMEGTKGVNMKEPYASGQSNHTQADFTPQDKCRQYDEIPAASPANGNLKSVEVTGTLLLGSLQTGMMLPLMQSPVQIEIELVPTSEEVVLTSWPASGNVPAGNYSTNWSVSSPRINATLAQLSTAGQSEFDRLLATSGVIVNARQFTSLQQTVSGESIRANFHISKSNMEDLFLTYSGTPQYYPEAGVAPGGDAHEKLAMAARLRAAYKTCNFFPHQHFFYVNGNGTNAQRAVKPNLTCRLSIGSKLIPEHEIRSPQESLMYTLQALGLTSMRDSIACTGYPYERTAFVQGFTCEKYFSPSEEYDGLGISTRDGSAITVTINGNKGGDPSLGAPLDRLFLTVVSSLKVEIKKGSTRISD